MQERVGVLAWPHMEMIGYAGDLILHIEKSILP